MKLLIIILLFLVSSASQGRLQFQGIMTRPSVAVSSLLTGLQVYYKLEDTSDSSGNGLTLINSNSLAFSAGKVNNAVVLDGVFGHDLHHADNARYQPGTGDWSLSFWLKFTQGNSGFIGYGKPNSFPGYIVYSSGGKIVASISDGTASANPIKATTSNDGNWHFVVLTLNRAGNATLYVDNDAGTTASMTSVTGSLNDTQGQDFSIGSEHFGDWFAGSMDEVFMANRVWTGPEITAQWNSGNGTTYPF